MAERTGQYLNHVIENYLKSRSIFYDNPAWIIKESPLGGFGVFARRKIEVGEIIFLDSPIIIGPRNASGLPDICVSCFSKNNLKTCDCGLTVCLNNCNLNEKHAKECQLIQKFKPKDFKIDSTSTSVLLRSFTPLRSLILNNEDKEVIENLKYHRGSQHGVEIDILKNKLGFNIDDKEKKYLEKVCSVLDANAFEVVKGDEDNQTSIRGLFPLGSLANHRCYPNVYHVFDEQQRMVVRAAVLIKQGEEILNSYSRIIWGTSSRIYHLRNTKHFICKCERCQDPTEFGTYMNAIICKQCKGRVVPIYPIKQTSWKCEDCEKIVNMKDVGQTLSLIGCILRGFGDNDFKLMHSFLCGKLATMVSECNQAIVEIKYKIIWILGHKPGFLWKELSSDLLTTKKNFCQDILHLLEKLHTGQSKIRGLVLYEIYLCIEELKRRENNNDIDIDSKKYFEEAADILRYDVSAPCLIKQKWEQSNGINGNVH